MHLTKLELQEMLREMGVKFSHTESYENLKKMFQEENHMRWMGKINPSGQRQGGRFKTVIRKRANSESKKMMVLSKPAALKHDSIPEPSGISKNDRTLDFKDRIKKKKPFVKSDAQAVKFASPKAEGPIFDRSLDVFATVLRRAQHCCELCGRSADVGTDPDAIDGAVGSLKPYHIKPLAEGGEASIKNMVALCDGCHQHLCDGPQPGDLKQLKRKARGRIIQSIQIQHKPRF